MYILQTISDVDPLEYGPSARGKLTEYFMSKGGKTLGYFEPIGKFSDMFSIQYPRQTMDAAVATGEPLIFDLTI